jgi:hypothetical protein
MGKVYLTLFIAAVHFASFGQNKGQEKNTAVADRLVGAWKFDYAVYGIDVVGRRFADTSKLFHTDTIHFFRDMTFRFRSHNTAKTDQRLHTGTWEITNKGRTLIHKNRVAQPPFDGHTPDLTFPVRIINQDRIRIDYIFIDEESTKPPTNNTPVFFDRIR